MEKSIKYDLGYQDLQTFLQDTSVICPQVSRHAGCHRCIDQEFWSCIEMPY